MLYPCAKCNIESSTNEMIVEGGIGYLFCKSCSEILSQLPPGNVTNFMGPKKETWVEKNMKEARKRRKEGKSPWLTKLIT